MVTLQNKKTGEKRTWDTDNADILRRLTRKGWVLAEESQPEWVIRDENGGIVPTADLVPPPATVTLPTATTEKKPRAK